MAESINTDNGAIHIINTRNGGALPYLEDDDIIEIGARIGKNGAEVIPCRVQGNAYVRGIVQTVKAYERLTVESALNGSRADAIRALMLNPLISDYDTAVKCFDEMLEAHRKYLPRFK